MGVFTTPPFFRSARPQGWQRRCMHYNSCGQLLNLQGSLHHATAATGTATGGCATVAGAGGVEAGILPFFRWGRTQPTAALVYCCRALASPHAGFAGIYHHIRAARSSIRSVVVLMHTLSPFSCTTSREEQAGSPSTTSGRERKPTTGLDDGRQRSTALVGHTRLPPLVCGPGWPL